MLYLGRWKSDEADLPVNTLNNLYALSLQRSDRVPGVIMKLSGLMRYVLESGEKESVPLIDEIRFLESYIDLEKLRMNSEPDIDLEVRGGVGNLNIAPMMILPFVENGFKHGSMSLDPEGYMHIRVNVRKDRLVFTVENSKVTASLDREIKSSRIGLDNIKKRLKLHYPETHNLAIQEDEDRYLVELSIIL